MNLKDEIIIFADKKVVWEKLNQAEVLQVCIPGCSELKGNTQQGFSAVVTQKVGPVKATFKGVVTVSEIIDQKSYTLQGEGKGGAAGFAKGEAKVLLMPISEGTKLSYEVQAKIGGKIAQLGGRLINGFAKNIAKKFFENFKNAIET
jgi:carbon monoxide dehydrogenase subunit G